MTLCLLYHQSWASCQFLEIKILYLLNWFLTHEHLIFTNNICWHDIRSKLRLNVIARSALIISNQYPGLSDRKPVNKIVYNVSIYNRILMISFGEDDINLFSFFSGCYYLVSMLLNLPQSLYKVRLLGNISIVNTVTAILGSDNILAEVKSSFFILFFSLIKIILYNICWACTWEIMVLNDRRQLLIE